MDIMIHISRIHDVFNGYVEKFKNIFFIHLVVYVEFWFWNTVVSIYLSSIEVSVVIEYI